MEDGSIPDARISASSYHSSSLVPSKARLNKPSYWCPASKAIGTEYLQIDLGSIKWVTKVATQGAPNLSTSEWVKNYTLSFANDTSTWKDYKPDQTCTKVRKKTCTGHRTDMMGGKNQITRKPPQGTHLDKSKK